MNILNSSLLKQLENDYDGALSLFIEATNGFIIVKFDPISSDNKFLINSTNLDIFDYSACEEGIILSELVNILHDKVIQAEVNSNNLPGSFDNFI